MKFNALIIINWLCLLKLILSSVDPVKDFTSNVHRKCNHEKKTSGKHFLSGKYDRKLANTYYNEIKFQNMRMHFDYTYTLPHEEKLIRELVMPPVKRFFENTLSVRRFPGKIRFPKSVKDCQGVPVPKHLQSEGVDADMVIVVSTYTGMKKFYYENIMKNQNSSWSDYNSMDDLSNRRGRSSMNDYLAKFFTIKNSTNESIPNTTGNASIPPWAVNDAPKGVVGWSFLCVQDVYTLRPLAGVMQYVEDILPTPRAIEEAIWTTLHEITHVLAMDYELYGDFIDSEFNKLGFDKTLKMKTRLKDLDKILEERKHVLNDFNLFANFNSTIIHNPNTIGDKNASVTMGESLNANNKLRKITNSTYTKKNPSTIRHPPSNNSTLNSNNTIFINDFNNSETIDKLLKSLFRPSIRLPLTDQYYEIKIPKEFNLTVLSMYIENFIENTKLYIKTPKVVEVGKKHFGCVNLEGVELEHHGGLGSAFSHWSKRVLNTEFMISDSYGENYISNFTLALFEDSGWYKVDYSKAEVVHWGKDKGCDFLEEKCIVKKTKKTSFFTLTQDKINQTESIPTSLSAIYTSKYNEFCTSFDEEKCSISHTFRAVCSLTKYPEKLPTQFQYFDNPHVGGIMDFGDYCPYPVEWIDPASIAFIGSCRNGIQLRGELGEKICENCRCFHSSLVEEKVYKKNSDLLKRNPKNAKYPHLEDSRATCYEARCRTQKNGNTELIIIIDDTEIKCPRGGAILSVEGYKGFIECPKTESVCIGTLDPYADYTSTSAYNLFSHLSEQLLNLLYDFINKYMNTN